MNNDSIQPTLGAATGLAPRAGRVAKLAVMFTFAAALSACGGGGSSESPTPSPTPTPTPTPPPPPPAAGNISIAGTATFESVPAASNGGLNYAGRTQKPVRGASVQLIDVAGTAVANTTTSATGAYAFSNIAQGTYSVRVRAELVGSTHDFKVVDNTSGGALYTMASAAQAYNNNATVDLAAPSGWGGASYTATRVAGPFSILDVAYQAKEKIASVAPATVMKPLLINWSVNNRPASGSVANGDIGTSYFTVGTNNVASLYILGAANVDTDEYDLPVVAHEIGHFMQHALFADDSMGGSHSGNDKLDMRVAFSEGWGNAWASMVLNTPTYHDSRGSAQASGFNINVATTPAAGNTGWYNEHTVEFLLYTYHQDPAIGFAGVYAAMSALRDAPVFTSIHAFTQRLRDARPSANVLVRASSVGVNGTDLYASGETNNGGLSQSLPVYKDLTFGTTQQVCNTTAFGLYNKLGVRAYLKFTGSGVRNIFVTRAAGTTTTTDPDLALVTSTGQRAVYETDTADSEIWQVSLPTGTHVLSVFDFKFKDTSGNSCFDVRIE